MHAYLDPAAERGEPWAQLRLGVTYELGVGVEKDINKAIEWYTKAAAQEGEGAWAEGQIVGAVGKTGFFNQKSDALIAQHQMANIYLKGEGVPRDLSKAFLLESHVSAESKGQAIFYCYGPNGRGQYITAEAISNTLLAIEKEMTPK